MANKRNGTLYIGVTSDIIKRIYAHKNSFVDGFTKKYSIKQLVYYENFNDIREAIRREKFLKKSSRQEKLTLIETKNPNWNDLYDEITK